MHDYCLVMYKKNLFFALMQAIPKKFATNVRGQISEEVKLEVPNCRRYDVKVAKEQYDLVIGSGWATFASAHDRKPGDFLVFTYSGHSHFNVRILDPSGCEKDYSCVPMDGIPCVLRVIICNHQRRKGWQNAALVALARVGRLQRQVQQTLLHRKQLKMSHILKAFRKP
uniref:TF-B3 domain-containing protein n=1 Tax=Arundo donax TaxID=35708 RepID=A0A0A9CHS2_ARUDO